MRWACGGGCCCTTGRQLGAAESRAFNPARPASAAGSWGVVIRVAYHLRMSAIRKLKYTISKAALQASAAISKLPLVRQAVAVNARLSARIAFRLFRRRRFVVAALVHSLPSFMVCGLAAALVVLMRRPGDSDMAHALRIVSAVISIGFPLLDAAFRALDYQARAKRRWK